MVSQNCFLLYFRAGFALSRILSGLLLDILSLPSVSGPSLLTALGKLEFLHALSQSTLVSELAPPLYAINFAFADTVIFRDQKPHK